MIETVLTFKIVMQNIKHISFIDFLQHIKKHRQLELWMNETHQYHRLPCESTLYSHSDNRLCMYVFACLRARLCQCALYAHERI